MFRQLLASKYSDNFLKGFTKFIYVHKFNPVYIYPSAKFTTSGFNLRDTSSAEVEHMMKRLPQAERLSFVETSFKSSPWIYVFSTMMGQLEHSKAEDFINKLSRQDLNHIHSYDLSSIVILQDKLSLPTLLHFISLLDAEKLLAVICPTLKSYEDKEFNKLHPTVKDAIYHRVLTEEGFNFYYACNQYIQKKSCIATPVKRFFEVFNTIPENRQQILLEKFAAYDKNFYQQLVILNIGYIRKAISLNNLQYFFAQLDLSEILKFDKIRIKTPYEVLNLPNGEANIDKIRQAYHRLAFLHHPDKGGDAQLMQEINSSYTTLKTKLNF